MDWIAGGLYCWRGYTRGGRKYTKGEDTQKKGRSFDREYIRVGILYTMEGKYDSRHCKGTRYTIDEK